MFIPHVPGVYIALVLKQFTDIETDNQLEALKSRDMNTGHGLQGSSSSSSLLKSDSGSSKPVGSV